MAKPNDYQWIARWGRNMGSFDYYITQEQRRAADEDAPIDAIYKAQDGEWHTIHDVTNPMTQWRFENLFPECKEPGFWKEPVDV